MVSKGEKQRREKIKKNNAKYWLGKKRSFEDREKMRQAKIGRYLGENNPFYGKHLSLEARKIISEANKGRKATHPFPKGHIPWNKGIKSHNSGEKHYNWQGGITPLNLKIRNSLEYKLWREAVFKRDSFTCQICGIKNVYFHAHHIKPFSLFPKLRFAIDNGQTLCVPCHKMTDTFKGKAKKYIAGL